MKRFLNIIIAFLLTAVSMNAQHVNEEQALLKAQEFLNKKVSTQKSGKNRAPRKLRSLAKASQSDAYYIFNAESNGGFVIVSGDDRTEEILGYSTEGNINPTDMPENMKGLLQSYEEQIKAIPEDYKAVPSKVSTHTAVEPMITSRWGQDAPYNSECPTAIPDGKTEPQHCVTGCMATALAQIMYYHKWPQTSTSAIPAYNYGGGYCDELPPTTFDWEHMKDVYVSTSSGVSANAVAHLMRYCGQALKMSYGLDESGTIMQEFRSIYKYLGYSDKARLINLFSFSIEEWDEMIYHEIQSRRPVLYAGSLGVNFSHAVVCDGYDGNGFYHFNFGWNGYTNYYGRLLAGPKIISTNGSSYSFHYMNGDKFWINPQAVIGIQKDDDHAEDIFTENVLSKFEIDDNGNKMIICSNLSNSDLLIDAGFYCINMNDLSTTPVRVSVQNRSLPYSYAVNLFVQFSDMDFTEGVKYRIVPVWKESSESDWHMADNKYTAFLELDNGNLIITPLKSVDYEVSIEMEGSLVDNTDNNNADNYYCVTFMNHGADLIRTFYISALDSEGNVLFEDHYDLSLSEGEEGKFANYLGWRGLDNIGTYSIVVSEDNNRNHIIAKKDFKISRRMQIYSTDGEYDWKNKTLSAKISNQETSISYNQEVRAYFFHSEGSYYPYAVKSSRISLASGKETIVTFDCHEVPFNFTDKIRVVVNLNEDEERYPTYFNCTWDLHYTNLKRITIYDSFYYDNGSGQYLCYVIDDIQNKCYINSINASQSQETIPGKVKNPFSNEWFDVVGIPPVSYGDYFGSFRNFIHKGVEKIVVEEGIETIGNKVLQDSCQKLQSIVFPTTLRNIGNFAMGKCPELKSIYCKAEVPPIITGDNENGFTNKSIIQTDFIIVGDEWNEEHHEFNYDDVILYVPIGCKAAYADAWGAFTNIVEMDIEDMSSINSLKGDADGDGVVDVADLQRIINIIIGTMNATSTSDVNGDGEIDIADIQNIINIILGNANAQYNVRGWVSMDRTGITNDDYLGYKQACGKIDVDLNNNSTYSAFQMKVTLPEGVDIASVEFNKERLDGFTKLVKKIGEQQYLVMGYSMEGYIIEGDEGNLLTINTKGNGNVIISDVVFSTPDAISYQLRVIGDVETGIKDIAVTRVHSYGNTVYINIAYPQEMSVYSIGGQLIKKVSLVSGLNSFTLPKGQYIINNQKVIIDK